MTLLALSLTMSVTACKKKKTADTGTASGTATMAGSDTMADAASMAGSGSDTMAAGSGSDTMAGSGAGSADDTMTKRAGNCPSTVLGSTTKAEVKGKDVVLTITSDDKDAIATIQRRAEELLKEKADGAGSGGGAHDQKGSHGGERGICPVYWTEGGKATSKKDAKGVVITITPKEKADDLKKMIDERITKAADWVKANVKAGDGGNSGGVGGGKGDHGGNHSGSGDGKGKERGTGGGAGTGGGGSKGTGPGSGAGSAK
ncbi:MAG: hypothetical protein M4D80_03225 [Myxococcota bacterium]|nr:hypothetical protein [Deltaproteobacteria bacterium]MDQ3334146.1 hypothetical protein [Myxococcota bacterium]